MRVIKNLSNHLLIATPNMDDERFERSVALICEHGKDGAMGIVINQPMHITQHDLLHSLDIDANLSLNDPVLKGGPMQGNRGFVVHKRGFLGTKWQSSASISKQLSITTSHDILRALGQKKIAGDALIALGHAGWEAGQLESELRDDCWLAAPADMALLFDVPVARRWQAALSLLGVREPYQFSSRVGHG